MHPLIRSFSLIYLATLAAITAQAETGILWVKVLIPPFENESENFVTVYLTARGDREALESGKFAVALAAMFNATLTPKLKDERTTEEERRMALAEVARSFGLTPEETDRAIREWGKKAADPYDKGEIALYQQNYPEATEQLSKSYEMRKSAYEKALAEMVEVAFSLGQSLFGQGKYRESVEKLREANALRNDDADIINYLGIALLEAGHYTEAEPHLNRALAISEKSLGVDHPDTATSLNNLALLYKSRGKYAEAEPLNKRAIAIREKSLGADHADTATSLNNLASLYESQGKYAEAEPLYKRALAIVNKALGAEHPNVATVMENYAELLRKMNREAEAEKLEARAKEIRAKAGNK